MDSIHRSYDSFKGIMERPRQGQKMPPKLADLGHWEQWKAVKMWPTPHGNCHTGAGEHGAGARNLQTAVLLPTPKGRDWKGQTQRGIHAPNDALTNQDRGDGKPIGGQLNPTWVEWLMGYPEGWTDLGDSEMPSSRRSHTRL